MHVNRKTHKENEEKEEKGTLASAATVEKND
jgi:hypothetical protein